jgi:hypothetical protein
MLQIKAFYLFILAAAAIAPAATLPLPTEDTNGPPNMKEFDQKYHDRQNHELNDLFRTLGHDTHPYY